MKVHEFAKRIGLPNSTIRFYDRENITASGRNKSNNYRDYQNLDALVIYSAQSLRGFNFSMEDTKKLLNSDVLEYSQLMKQKEAELELDILRSKQRLKRLKEMTSCMDIVEKIPNQVFEYDLGEHYIIKSFGDDIKQNLNAVQKKTIADLSEALPFSYVALHIKKENILAQSKFIAVQIGLGILERKRKEIDLQIDKSIECIGSKRVLALYAKVKNPFLIERKIIQPILERLEESNKDIKDFYGKLHISYTEKGEKFYGIMIGCAME